ncbi:MAG TPA: DNA photolyase [Proteobacteria bacterium]|nr:DNA photolyase [Pseudomonadota bacterium]
MKSVVDPEAKYARSLLRPTTLLIEEEIFDLPLTQAIRGRLPQAEVVVVERPDAEKLQHLSRRFSPLSTLLLARHRGRFLKACPGTDESYRCCLYQILHLGLGCNIGCSYCVLQGYLNNPFITQFVNLEEAFAELDRELERPGVFYRIGTGEFTDSLFMDPLTGLAPRLLDYFGSCRHAVLELKTKSVAIASLLDYPGEIGETIVSWSLNAPSVSAREEGHAASLTERLQAAARCRRRGYRIGLHFDPLFDFQGWQDEYRRTVALIFEHLGGDDIIWISIGAFRFMPKVRDELRWNHPRSNITAGEFIRGRDGKQRYFSAIRRRLYRFLVDEIKSYAPEVFIYFCMEDQYLWQDTFGYAPADNQELSHWLDRCCVRYREPAAGAS